MFALVLYWTWGSAAPRATVGRLCTDLRAVYTVETALAEVYQVETSIESFECGGGA